MLVCFIIDNNRLKIFESIIIEISLNSIIESSYFYGEIFEIYQSFQEKSIDNRYFKARLTTQQNLIQFQEFLMERR